MTHMDLKNQFKMRTVVLFAWSCASQAKI